jgi:hypothetical protein
MSSTLTTVLGPGRTQHVHPCAGNLVRSGELLSFYLAYASVTDCDGGRLFCRTIRRTHGSRDVPGPRAADPPSRPREYGTSRQGLRVSGMPGSRVDSAARASCIAAWVCMMYVLS